MTLESASSLRVTQPATRRRLSAGPLLLAAPALALMGVAFGLPTLALVGSSFNAPALSLENYQALWDNPAIQPILLRTLAISLQVTAFCALIGYPLAYAMILAPPFWRKVMLALVVMPIWISILVRSYAWLAILGRNGAINKTLMALGLTNAPIDLLYTRFAVILGLVQVMLPYFVFPLYSAMKTMDMRLVHAARTLGASPVRAFMSVFFPLTLNGVATGCLTIFILTTGFYVTPMLLGGLKEITYVMLIERAVDMMGDWKMASAMSVVLLVVTLLLSGLFGKAFGFSGRGQRRRSAWIGRLAVAAAAVFARPSRGIERPRTRPPRHRCVRIAATLALVFMIAPLLVVVPLGFSSAPFLEFPPPGYSLRWYSNFLSRSDWLIPTWISFKVATITAGISTFLGVLAAIGLTRSRARLAGPLMAFLMSPLTLPHLIIAVGLYFQLAALGLVSTITGLVIGHTVLALPLVTIVIINALRTVDAAPETAACSLGAPPARAFLSTTLLALAPSVGSAALFAFLASFDDIIMALFLSGTSSPTLPKRMWEGIVVEIDPTVAAVSTLLVLFSAVLFLAAQGAVGLSRARRRGASSEIVEPARVI